ncbi:MAG: tRNA (adenosine(37)-N6)-threonylcarbamoyltransferase complex transferase subunit TsaD [Candidatus Brennerbacteria bacterium]|nr:tRNA (adenosine(37)-N6)-threonylcarbamoyltransferase complex transferase subunit TsaD [Candidatus Brennerbacteria bacterium]
MKILAIETSCDETALALVETKGGLTAPKFKILKNLVSSQIAVHRPFGGVVPNLAKREHLKNLPILFKKLQPKTYNSSSLRLSEPNGLQPDIVAVTVGPGLEPALWTGVNFAKEIRKNHFPKAKLIGANHLEGHLYSFLLAKKAGISNSKFLISKLFPAVHLLVSGGHTILVLMKSITSWRKLGETQDDAVGEAFDKVARMLDLPYPGGPEIEKLANYGLAKSIDFPRPMIQSKDYNFSFSGLKTSVLYHLRDNPKAKKADVAASFQKAAVDVLVSKTLRAAQAHKAKSIMLSGGVASNKILRQELKFASRKLQANFLSADKNFQTDNAVIIAVAAYLENLRRKNRTIRANANLNL